MNVGSLPAPASRSGSAEDEPRESETGRGYVPLVVRVAGVNALLLIAAVVVTILVLEPRRISSFAAKEAVVLIAALLLMALVNLLLLRRIVGPLQALTDLARRVDLANPGERMPGAQPTSEAGELALTFNEMLDRLESERREATGRVLAGQEAERLRIAQELHDQVGQELTAVLLVLSRLQNRVPETLRDDVVEIQEEVRMSLEDVRRIAVELRPEALDDLGLVSALAVLGQRFAERSALDVVERIAPDVPELGPDTELVVYRVAQEALTNVARHSGGNDAEVNLVTRGRAAGAHRQRPRPRPAARAHAGRGHARHARARGARRGYAEYLERPRARGLRGPSRRAAGGRPLAMSPTPLKTRILLADDHAVVRRGLRMVLDEAPDLEVVAEAGDGAEAVERAVAEDIDLAIIDISMPRMTGLQAVRELHRRRRGLRILILSMHQNEQYLYEALKAGASGYVLKTVADRDLVEACRAAMRGEPFLYPGAMTPLIEEYLHRARTDQPLREEPLTAREQEVVKLIAEGYSTRQIADELVISEKTVDRHRANILEKLGMHDRVELTRYAIRRGLVEP